MRIAREKFIADIAGYVKKYAGQYGILCHSAVISQAVLESGWGESRLTSQYYNYFGLKCGTRWTGRSVNMRTKEEYREGTLTSIRDNFRVFDSMEEGVKGYFEFIQLERVPEPEGDPGSAGVSGNHPCRRVCHFFFLCGRLHEGDPSV